MTSNTTVGALSISDATFERVRKLIYERAGISLNDNKRMLVYGRLTPLARRQGLGSIEQLLERIGRDGALEQDFINALTTNLTSFYREAHHFQMLGEALRASRGKVRIWCSAASTGEEPYSIALCCKENLPAGAQVEIIASDIDTTVLSKAKAGVYPEAAVASVPAQLRTRWFTRRDELGKSMVAVHDQVKSMVRFQQLNLVSTSWALSPGFDFIFCRNVLIYFDQQTKTAILRRMHSLLKPGGVLYVGHSEHFRDELDLFRAAGRTSYVRIER
ncbi:MAG: protein-glutamate O-methyltransferase CheR [Burkholderiaceae bacterium]